MANTLRDLITERDRAYQTHMSTWDKDNPDYTAWNVYRALDVQIEEHPIMRAIARFEEDSYTPNASMIDALIAAVEAESPEVRQLRGLLDELLVDDAEAIQQYDESGDFIGCAFCGLVWGVDNDADDPETPYPHTAACVVTRARAVGSGTAAESGG